MAASAGRCNHSASALSMGLWSMAANGGETLRGLSVRHPRSNVLIAGTFGNLAGKIWESMFALQSSACRHCSSMRSIASRAMRS